jgi:protein involved in polysaccharide export with SLBB domain
VSACTSTASGKTTRTDQKNSQIGLETISDTDRLEQLRLEREEDSFADKLGIGPGDLIEVSVPGVPELNRFKVRVSEDNTISIPLAGMVRVGGMVEQELRQALYQRLAKPMKNPDVEVFVDQYQSRDVAVVGMVQKAGLYSITSRADTVLAMINRAGGMTERASSRVLFIPASSVANAERMALAKGLAPDVESLGKVQLVRAGVDGTQREPPASRPIVSALVYRSFPAQIKTLFCR